VHPPILAPFSGRDFELRLFKSSTNFFSFFFFFYAPKGIPLRPLVRTGRTLLTWYSQPVQLAPGFPNPSFPILLIHPSSFLFVLDLAPQGCRKLLNPPNRLSPFLIDYLILFPTLSQGLCIKIFGLFSAPCLSNLRPLPATLIR